jgi:hypothetical protein
LIERAAPVLELAVPISEWQDKIRQYHHDLCPYVFAKIAPSHQQNQRFATRRHTEYVKHKLTCLRGVFGVLLVPVGADVGSN